VRRSRQIEENQPPVSRRLTAMCCAGGAKLLPVAFLTALRAQFFEVIIPSRPISLTLTQRLNRIRITQKTTGGKPSADPN
jgi:hypothetical protein